MSKLLINLGIYGAVVFLAALSEMTEIDEIGYIALAIIWTLIVFWIQSLFDKNNLFTAPLSHHIIASIAIYAMSGALISIGWVVTGVVAAIVRTVQSADRAVRGG